MPRATSKQVVIGVITGAIVTLFLQQPLEWLSKSMFEVFASVFENRVDRIYENASLGIRPWMDVTFLVGIFSVALGAYAGALIGPMLASRFRHRAVQQSTVRFFVGSTFAMICLGLLLPYFLMMLVLPAVWDIQLNAGFQRRVTALAPYIDEQSEEELRGLWSTMDSRDDHIHINNQLEMYASRSGIELPNTLID